jgi:hypothetical protein
MRALLLPLLLLACCTGGVALELVDATDAGGAEHAVARAATGGGAPRSLDPERMQNLNRVPHNKYKVTTERTEYLKSRRIENNLKAAAKAAEAEANVTGCVNCAEPEDTLAVPAKQRLETALPRVAAAAQRASERRRSGPYAHPSGSKADHPSANATAEAEADPEFGRRGILWNRARAILDADEKRTAKLQELGLEAEPLPAASIVTGMACDDGVELEDGGYLVTRTKMDTFKQDFMVLAKALSCFQPFAFARFDAEADLMLGKPLVLQGAIANHGGRATVPPGDPLCAPLEPSRPLAWNPAGLCRVRLS